MNIKNNQKGVVLYMTVVMMSILLSVILGLSTSIIGGLQLIVMIEDSIKSFYAADAGIEKALYNINSGNCNDFSGVFENDYMGSYDVTINYDNTGSYDGTISALGSYDQSRKKNEVLYNLPDPFPSLPFSCGNSFKDCRDGNTYPTVSIGSQCWIGENLKYLPSVVPPITVSETEPYYYVYGYEGTDVSTAKSLPNNVYNDFGALYNWEASLTACPNGWHLPSDKEWKILEISLGMTEEEADKYMEFRGVDEGTDLQQGIFQANPLGGYLFSEDFHSISSIGQFWTSDSSLYRSLHNGHPQVYRSSLNSNSGLSVRCVKD